MDQGPGSRRPRVLLEHQNPRVLARQWRTLEAAGFAVETCMGPSTFADRTCPLTSRGVCQKAAAADVVVAGLPAHDIAVYIALRTRFPDREVLLAMSEEERARLPLPHLLEEVANLVPRNQDGDELVATVRAAMGAPDPS
jgi:hypothetical protein